jgi:putative transcriptional regulator
VSHITGATSGILGAVTTIADTLTGLAGTQPVLRLQNRLRVARAEQRLSQEQLARMAGVTRQTISAIENGQYCPSALLAFILASELNKPVEELFYLDERKP